MLDREMIFSFNVSRESLPVLFGGFGYL